MSTTWVINIFQSLTEQEQRPLLKRHSQVSWSAKQARTASVDIGPKLGEVSPQQEDGELMSRVTGLLSRVTCHDCGRV